MKIRTATSAAAVLVLLTGVAACGGEDSAPATAPTTGAAETPAPVVGAAASGRVEAADQTSDGSSMVVSSVELGGADQGFIGVHSDLDGKPGPVVGFAKVSKGSTSELKVAFDKPVITGAYWPMLHVDDHAVGTYEFPKVPGADLPVKDGSEVVMTKVTLTVG